MNDKKNEKEKEKIIIIDCRLLWHFMWTLSFSLSCSTLKEILAALDDKLSSSDLDGIIAEIDTDGSGTVDFDGNDFNNWSVEWKNPISPFWVSRKLKMNLPAFFTLAVAQ